MTKKKHIVKGVRYIATSHGKSSRWEVTRRTRLDVIHTVCPRTKQIRIYTKKQFAMLLRFGIVKLIRSSVPR